MVLQNGGIYIYLGWLAISGNITIADLSAYTSSIAAFIAALVGISGCLITLQKSGMYIDTYLDYLTQSESLSSCVKTIPSTKADEFELRFEDVWFKYPDQPEYTLKNINLTISKRHKNGDSRRKWRGKNNTDQVIIASLYSYTRTYLL